VLPAERRRGVGTALLRRLVAHVEGLGFAKASALVDEAEAMAFARRFGFEERDRQVQQVLTLGEPPPPEPLPAGVEVATVAERPELLQEAYPLAVEGYADLALERPATIELEEWLREEATLPEGSFVALADGEIVGYSGLMRHDNPGVAEDGLTVVRRDWRGRGLARALKQREIAWAAANGLGEIVTWTQRGNEAMRHVNERLGYALRSECITVLAELPLRGLP
jgi:GNAT superfamily N-acetyltransferase